MDMWASTTIGLLQMVTILRLMHYSLPACENFQAVLRHCLVTCKMSGTTMNTEQRTDINMH